MTIDEQLLGQLRTLGLDIPEDAQLIRIPSSRAEKQLGAWSWTVADADGTPLTRDSQGRMMSIGSHWAVHVLAGKPVSAHPSVFGDVNIEPDTGPAASS
ncbi:hypothetical protein [Streptomyces griseoaurantiacus]|uniref:hypothetical protein n=1 Tax=Streptomyces griseoaurantiacus TaxID=68213 RepID=UPI0036CFAE0B